MPRVGVIGCAGVLFLVLTGAAAAGGLTSPRNQTFPSMEPELKPLRQKAYDLAVASEAKATADVLYGMAKSVEAKYGSDSREMLDFRGDQAALLSLAGDGPAALDAARQAVVLARRMSAAYAFFGGSDPTIMLDDQTLAFRQFVQLADTHRDDVADPAALLNEAFRVSQMAELGKASVAAYRKLQEQRLPAGELRDLFLLAWTTSDRVYPLNYAKRLFAKLGQDMAKAGLVTMKDLEVLNDDIETQNASIALLGGYTEGLEAVLLPEPMDIAAVQDRLDGDEAYLSVVSGSDGYLYVFCVTRKGFLFKELGFNLNSVEDLIAKLRQAMNVPNGRGAMPVNVSPDEPSREVLETAWQLYEELFFDIQNIVAGKKHLWLSVSGELAKFPFEALVTRQPNQDTTFANAAWFVRQHAITVLPTLALLGGRPSALPSSPIRYLGIGNPDYQALAAWDLRPHATRDVEKLVPLPESAVEARDIGKALSARADDILVGEAASETRLQELSRSGALAGYDVLLFATHGLLPQEMEDAFEGGLALTPTRDHLPPPSLWKEFVFNLETDGLLTPREIATLKLDADLVVLSACNTGTASPIDSQGYSGMTQAFLLAGARTMVVSHWPVVSDAAVAITTRMLGGLKGPPSGKSLALAHRLALLDVIASGERRAHPRYWAPFSIVGGP